MSKLTIYQAEGCLRVSLQGGGADMLAVLQVESKEQADLISETIRTVYKAAKQNAANEIKFAVEQALRSAVNG